ncbi:MAG: 3-phosphoshikimate 1-carboxyvinyltransferase [Bacteroidota bacterium]
MKRTVEGARRLRGTIQLPPDKSISHRAALFSAITEGQSVIENYSQAADPQSTLSCLRQLGVPVRQEGTTVTVDGVGRDGLQSPSEPLDCGNSGTTMRLLAGILTGAGVPSTMVGDASLSSRTMKRILDPLTAMGGVIRGRDQNFAPLEIDKGEIRGFRYELPIASAQLKSAVLLAGLYSEEPVEVIETIPSRDHTERLLRLPASHTGDGTILRSDRSIDLPVQSYPVPGDFSAAAFWVVAGAIHPDAELILPDVGLNPTRTAALNVLQEMGADIEIEPSTGQGAEPMGTITVRSSELRAVQLDPAWVPNAIDELPILMVAMSFAEGRSEITAAGELRHKETDRLAAMGRVLSVAGETFDLRPDGIRVQGRGSHRVQSGAYDSEHDHRIAMSAAVLGLMADGFSSVERAEASDISYPSFWEDLEQISRPG